MNEAAIARRSHTALMQEMSDDDLMRELDVGPGLPMDFDQPLVRLDVARVQQALAQYDFAQAAEKEGRLYTSLKAFRVANLNLNGLTEEALNGLVKEEPLTPEHVARALTIKQAVPADLVRVDGKISLPDENNQPRRVNE